MLEVNKKTYAKILKAKAKICVYCETDNCEDCNITKTLHKIKADCDKIDSEDTKPTTLYRIRFTMVLGYVYKTYVCIMQAENKEQVNENLYKWIAANPFGNKKIMFNCNEITPLTENKDGIVYQDIIKEEDTAYTEDSKTGELFIIRLITTAKNTIYNYTFIRRAENKEQARLRLYECISGNLPHNQHISYGETTIKRLVKDEYGIIFAEKPL